MECKNFEEQLAEKQLKRGSIGVIFWLLISVLSAVGLNILETIYPVIEDLYGNIVLFISGLSLFFCVSLPLLRDVKKIKKEMEKVKVTNSLKNTLRSTKILAKSIALCSCVLVLISIVFVFV